MNINWIPTYFKPDDTWNRTTFSAAFLNKNYFFSFRESVIYTFCVEKHSLIQRQCRFHTRQLNTNFMGVHTSLKY